MASSEAIAAYGPRTGLLAPLPPCERGVPLVLSASADGKLLCYGSTTNVVIRSTESPSLVVTYGQHTAPVKVAKFAPTGKYVASGDNTGKVRVWAYTHPEQLLKYELPSIGGEIEDVAWDSESKRIAAVGGGSAKAKIFSWDAGSQLGEIVPHTKKNLTVDFKPTRPFRVVLGGEDFQLSFYQGPPFRFDKSLKDHTNFVNCVRYSPDGSRFVSVASDKTGIVYHGDTAAIMGKLDTASTHTGSIFACAWSPDGSQLVTSGGDKKLKIWAMSGTAESFPCIATIAIGERVEDMQLGVVWPLPGTIVSVSLDGTLNYINPVDGSISARVQGHRDPTLAMIIERRSGNIYSADSSGRVCVWRPKDESRTIFEARNFSGDGPTKKVSGLAVSGGVVAAGAWDDKLRLGDAVTGEWKKTVPLPGQPKGVAVSPADPSTCVVVTSAAILVVTGNGSFVAAPVAVSYGATCVSISTDGLRLFVGGSDKRVYAYSLDAGGAISLLGSTAEAGSAISVISISPDGKYLAVGDSLKEVLLIDAETRAVVVSSKWLFHTTRITGLSWSPSSRLLASVSTDRRLCIWDPATQSLKSEFPLAHAQPLVAVDWASDDTLWIMGADGVVQRRVLPA